MSATTIDAKGIIIPCVRCGQKNRTPFERLGETGQCGKCQSPINPPAEPVTIPDEMLFTRLIQASALPVLIDFWAEWCGPCKAVAPELVKVAAEGRGQFVVGKVDTDKLQRVSQQYSIQSIPTMAVFHNGQEVTRTAGARPAAAILVFVRQAIGK